MRSRRSVLGVIGSATAATLAGCETVGDIAGGSGEPPGSLRVEATRRASNTAIDEFSTLTLSLESIALDRRDGQPVTLALGRTLDLTELTFEEHVVFYDATTVPAGRYTAYELVAPTRRVRDDEGQPVDLASESPYTGTFSTEPNDLPEGRRAICSIGFWTRNTYSGMLLDVGVTFSLFPEN